MKTLIIAQRILKPVVIKIYYISKVQQLGVHSAASRSYTNYTSSSRGCCSGGRHNLDVTNHLQHVFRVKRFNNLTHRIAFDCLTRHSS
jgi:hypothetical protein